mmetsp:Transcript_25748/g.67576  ORF Transcript_25748/g.67576 Transcript_25748/m.67576 type:complete len:209 (-) Transcript_25748:38-664(-)
MERQRPPAPSGVGLGVVRRSSVRRRHPAGVRRAREPLHLLPRRQVLRGCRLLLVAGRPRFSRHGAVGALRVEPGGSYQGAPGAVRLTQRQVCDGFARTDGSGQHGRRRAHPRRYGERGQRHQVPRVCGQRRRGVHAPADAHPGQLWGALRRRRSDLHEHRAGDGCRDGQTSLGHQALKRRAGLEWMRFFWVRGGTRRVVLTTHRSILL